MNQWFQICNLRTTLLHLQFLHASLSQKVEEQQLKVDRSHKDRLMQYSLLWQDYLTLEGSNFKKLIIIKLQSCIAAHQGDNEIWQLLDNFKIYSGAIERQMMENMSKLYIGKKVLFNIQEVEEQLTQIQSKISSFLTKYTQNIEEYKESIVTLNGTRQELSRYMGQVKQLYNQIQGGYGSYLKKRLQRRSKELQNSIQELRQALLV